MQGQRRGGLAGRQRNLLLLVGLPAIAAALLLAAWSWREGREVLLGALVERAGEQRLAVDAVLGGPGERETADEAPAGDMAGRLDRARELVAGLAWPAGSVRLVEAAAAPAEEPGRVLVRPVGDGRLQLVHRIEPDVLPAAGRAAALPWLALAAALALTLGLAQALLRRQLVAPTLAALDGLVDLAAGLPARAGAAAQGWAAPWLEAAAAAARGQAGRLAAAEAVEAPLAAALEGVAQGVALLDPEGRLQLANRALGEALRALGQEPPRPGAALAPATRAALVVRLGASEVALASGGRLFLLPPAPGSALGHRPGPAEGWPPGPALAGGRGGPRLAAMVQEVGEALALVARQAVLLHELAADETTRGRALELRRAAERCTRAIAPLLAPPRPLPPRPVAVDRLVEDRLERLGRAGVALSAGLAPALPPVSGDPDRLGDLLDGLLASLLAAGGAGPPVGLRVRLRRAGGGLRLDLERVEPAPEPVAGGLRLLEHRARELGVGFEVEPTAPGGRLVRLEWPHGRAAPVEAAPGRLVVIAGERGAA